MAKTVRVLIGKNGLPKRIFRDKQWLDFPSNTVVSMDRSEAVKIIREQVFDRCHVYILDAGYDFHECERCSKSINWMTMEMHERIPKGKGGEVSLENCEALCHSCHTGSPDSAHGNRRWQTSKISPEGPNGN